MSENKPKEFVVYRVYHIDTGKSYIGITIDYERRMKEHFRGKGNCRYLYNAIRKHSKEKFKHEIVFECDSWKELCKEEIKYINIFNTKIPNGYNLTDGGEGAFGLKHSSETKRKMSITASNRSDEYKRKMTNTKNNFSNDQILEIKQMLIAGIFQKDIAKKFGVAQSTIGCIKRCKHYSEIQVPGGIFNNSSRGKYKFTNDQILIIKQKKAKSISKLSKGQVLEIKKLLNKGIFQRIIAKQFNVSCSTVGNIKTGKGEYYADIQLPKETI